MTKEEFLELMGKGSKDEDKKLIEAIEKVFDEKEKEIKHSDEEESLEHHGIDGMKWGVRNGPPYPLERQKGAKLSSKQKAKILQDNVDMLTLEDIEKLLKRIELEEKINKLSAEEKKKGNGMVKKILESSGKAIVATAVPALTMYAFKKIVENVGGPDVVNEMFPKKK